MPKDVFLIGLLILQVSFWLLLVKPSISRSEKARAGVGGGGDFDPLPLLAV